MAKIEKDKVHEAIVEKVTGRRLPDRALMINDERLLCPKCGKPTLVCCYLDLNCTSYMCDDNYIHVCMDADCDYGKYDALGFSQEGQDCHLTHEKPPE